MNSSPVRVGVIGTTSYAETHISRIVEHPDATVVAVAGRNEARARALAQRYAVPTVHLGWESLLESRAVDAVVVVAPDDLHEVISVAALNSGVHVLCEKPLARTPSEARRMWSAAKESGLVNMSYFALHTTAIHQYLGEVLRQGEIGDVLGGSLSLEHGFFRSPEYNWRFDARRGGGVMADLGCYLFDLARLYVGEIESLASHGAAQITRPHPDEGSYPPADDSTVGVIAFDAGAHVTFGLSVTSDIGPGFQKNVVELQGTKGRLELTHTFASSELRLLREGSDEIHTLAPPPGFSAPSGDAEFIDAITSGRMVSSDFFGGWQVQKAVAAGLLAAEEHRWVRIDEFSEGIEA